jgi:hypothetical protein
MRLVKAQQLRATPTPGCEATAHRVRDAYGSAELVSREPQRGCAGEAASKDSLQDTVGRRQETDVGNGKLAPGLPPGSAGGP